jgi:hypothetical protein
MTFRMASIEVPDYRKDGEGEARGDDARLISRRGPVFSEMMDGLSRH